MEAVEKMAARVLHRNGLIPPYNLEALASKYGNVEYHRFPLNADGVTVGIGRDTTPQILVNKGISQSRQKFTLAHELGHVIIPWHVGTIVSHLELKAYAQDEYRQMESEANRFAAELLIPTVWTKKQVSFFKSYGKYLEFIVASTGASRDAVLIKIFPILDQPIVCAQHDESGEIINYYHTPSAPPCFDLSGKNISRDKLFLTPCKTEEFYLGDRRYYLWEFEKEAIDESDSRSWREILSIILSEADCEHLQQNVNAVLPSEVKPNKHGSVNEICNAVMRRYDGRDSSRPVVAHPLFKQYVVKRVKELIARRKKMV